MKLITFSIFKLKLKILKKKYNLFHILEFTLLVLVLYETNYISNLQTQTKDFKEKYIMYLYIRIQNKNNQ